jgi:hypothetical protein
MRSIIPRTLMGVLGLEEIKMSEEPRQKHETRNPVDIMLIQSNAVSAIGKKHEEIQELKMELTATKQLVATYQQRLALAGKIIESRDIEISQLQCMNRMWKTLIILLIGLITITLCLSLTRIL